jgi:hypothetical protein
MLKPFTAFLRRERREGVSEGELRVVVDRLLRRYIPSERVFCERVAGGEASVAVPSALFQQEVYLLFFEVARELAREYGYGLRRLSVIQRW